MIELTIAAIILALAGLCFWLLLERKRYLITIAAQRGALSQMATEIDAHHAKNRAAREQRLKASKAAAKARQERKATAASSPAPTASPKPRNTARKAAAK